MTTQAAAEAYEAAHVREWNGRPLAVFNPLDKPVEELPVIYGINNGGSPGWFSAAAVAADGTYLGGHVCSSEGYMPADLGMLEGSRPDRHESSFRPHYPDGYRCEFVGSDSMDEHEGVQAAIRLSNEADAKAKAEAEA